MTHSNNTDTSGCLAVFITFQLCGIMYNYKSYLCNHFQRISGATVEFTTVNVSTTTYSGTGGFGKLQLLLSGDAVGTGLGESAGGRAGTGGFFRISLLQYSTSASTSDVAVLARQETCNTYYLLDMACFSSIRVRAKPFISVLKHNATEALDGEQLSRISA
jgi:hypothetical protein